MGRVVTTLADYANSIFAIDVDGDGDVDALSASRLEDTVAWYENDCGTQAPTPRDPFVGAERGALLSAVLESVLEPQPGPIVGSERGALLSAVPESVFEPQPGPFVGSERGALLSAVLESVLEPQPGPFVGSSTPSAAPSSAPSATPSSTPTASFLRITSIGIGATCVSGVECDLLWVYRGDPGACATVDAEVSDRTGPSSAETATNDGQQTQTVAGDAEVSTYTLTLACSDDATLADSAEFEVSRRPYDFADVDADRSPHSLSAADGLERTVSRAHVASFLAAYGQPPALGGAVATSDACAHAAAELGAVESTHAASIGTSERCAVGGSLLETQRSTDAHSFLAAIQRAVVLERSDARADLAALADAELRAGGLLIAPDALESSDRLAYARTLDGDPVVDAERRSDVSGVAAAPHGERRRLAGGRRLDDAAPAQIDFALSLTTGGFDSGASLLASLVDDVLGDASSGRLDAALCGEGAAFCGAAVDTRRAYRFGVAAAGAEPLVLNVTVLVEDANDAPTVAAARLAIRAEAAAGTCVGAVAAADADANQTLALSVDDAGFAVDPATHFLTAARRVGASRGEVLALVVAAADDGRPRKTGAATVLVRVRPPRRTARRGARGARGRGRARARRGRGAVLEGAASPAGSAPDAAKRRALGRWYRVVSRTAPRDSDDDSDDGGAARRRAGPRDALRRGPARRRRARDPARRRRARLVAVPGRGRGALRAGARPASRRPGPRPGPRGLVPALGARPAFAAHAAAAAGAPWPPPKGAVAALPALVALPLLVLRGDAADDVAAQRGALGSRAGGEPARRDVARQLGVERLAAVAVCGGSTKVLLRCVAPERRDLDDLVRRLKPVAWRGGRATLEASAPPRRRGVAISYPDASFVPRAAGTYEVRATRGRARSAPVVVTVAAGTPHRVVLLAGGFGFDRAASFGDPPVVGVVDAFGNVCADLSATVVFRMLPRACADAVASLEVSLDRGVADAVGRAFSEEVEDGTYELEVSVAGVDGGAGAESRPALAALATRTKAWVLAEWRRTASLRSVAALERKLAAAEARVAAAEAREDDSGATIAGLEAELAAARRVLANERALFRARLAAKAALVVCRDGDDDWLARAASALAAADDRDAVDAASAKRRLAARLAELAAARAAVADVSWSRRTTPRRATRGAAADAEQRAADDGAAAEACAGAEAALGGDAEAGAPADAHGAAELRAFLAAGRREAARSSTRSASRTRRRRRPTRLASTRRAAACGAPRGAAAALAERNNESSDGDGVRDAAVEAQRLIASFEDEATRLDAKRGDALDRARRRSRARATGRRERRARAAELRRGCAEAAEAAEIRDVVSRRVHAERLSLARGGAFEIELVRMAMEDATAAHARDMERLAARPSSTRRSRPRPRPRPRASSGASTR
ncbi:hypothetical protein JL722_1614 [Aureococcus anophagefferens]|nr:hypothetical protein JL722_1614 [Aureococcus anophagefferens]